MSDKTIKTRKPFGKNDDRPRNTTFTIELFNLARTEKLEYDRTGLLEILSTVPFDKISVPVYTYKNLVFNNDSKGTMAIGYVKGFDPETEKFEVVIYGNYVETVKNYGEDTIIYPRVFVSPEDGAVKSVIGLDVCPIVTYGHLYDPV